MGNHVDPIFNAHFSLVTCNQLETNLQLKTHDKRTGNTLVRFILRREWIHVRDH